MERARTNDRVRYCKCEKMRFVEINLIAVGEVLTIIGHC